MFKDEIYLKLSDFVYAEKEFSNYDNYEQLVINGLTNEEGYYINENFACAAYKKGNKIIISFRGTDDPKDIYDADLNILINNLPEDDFLKAEYFYKQLVNSSKYGECEIEFTGHSLGGAIAQLMGAKYGNKTVTFNAPGMYDQLEDIGCSTSIKYNYITNYTVLNDYIGNYKAHVGYTYYMQPLPIEKETLFDTHMGIFNYDENIHGAFISKPSGFTTLDALALWYFDVNNTLSPNISIASMNETQLVHAISIVEQCFGDADIQINPIKCTVNGKYFIVGSKGDDLLEGASKNDKLWGNDGDDTLYGYDGNDTIYSVQGDDVLIGGKGNDDLRGSQGFDTYIFYTGDGNDVIKETNQYRPSVKGISYYLKRGQIQVDGAILTGGTWDETTQTYVGYQSGVTYSWSGVDNTQMIINYGNGDTIKIANFDNGDLGLFFDREIITDKDDIPDRLTRMKQVYADLQANNICNAYN